MNIPPLISRSPPPLDDDAEDEEDDEDEFRHIVDRMGGVITDQDAAKPDFLFQKTNCVKPETVMGGDIIFESQLTKSWEQNIPPNASLNPDSSLNHFPEVYKLSITNSTDNVKIDEDSKHSISPCPKIADDNGVVSEVMRISGANVFHSGFIPLNCTEVIRNNLAANIDCPDGATGDIIHENPSPPTPQNETSLNHNGSVHVSGTAPETKNHPDDQEETTQSLASASPDIASNEVFPNGDELHLGMTVDVHNNDIDGSEMSCSLSGNVDDSALPDSINSLNDHKEEPPKFELSASLSLDFEELNNPQASEITSDLTLESEITVEHMDGTQNISSKVYSPIESPIVFTDLQSSVLYDSNEDVVCDSSKYILDEETILETSGSARNEQVEPISLEEENSFSPSISICDMPAQGGSLSEKITKQINLEIDSDNDSFDDFVSFNPPASTSITTQNVSDPKPSSSNAGSSLFDEPSFSDEFGDYKHQVPCDEFTDFTWFDAATVTNLNTFEGQSTAAEEPFSDVAAKDILPLCLNEALKSNNVWWTLSNFDSTPALSYKWTASSANRKLLRALKIDSRNILAAPWSRSVSNKGMISFDGKYTGSESESPNSSSENKAAVPQPHFDWVGSGLVNPLDVNQKVHFPQTKGNTLSFEAASFLQTLPNLSYMHQRSFVFPKKIK